MRREFPHKLPVQHIGAAARQREANNKVPRVSVAPGAAEGLGL